jgi:NADPH-dependent 2,4-dienoyl-CoA reductase/sulfur reductase-like enzyme
MAAGVRPRSELAAEAGLQVGPRGGITVNECMKTSDPNIYAAGDCVELPNLITGKKMILAMGSIANRSVGLQQIILQEFLPVLKGCGSLSSRPLRLRPCGGLVALQAKMEALMPALLFMASDRAHFYPERGALALGLVYDKKTRKVLGLQGAGPATDSLLARINAAAIAIAEGAHVDDFGNAELAYGPPSALH